MLVAAGWASPVRANLPVALACVWLSNPLTYVPMFYFAYKLGCWLLGVELTTTETDLTMNWLYTRLSEIWQPFLLGCLVCAWLLATAAYAITNLIWRIHVIERWRSRKVRRAKSRPTRSTQRPT